MVVESFAQDGINYPSGAHLFPIDSTEITIKKETISFDCNLKSAKVSMYIEFFNPTNSVINQKAGFKTQAPEWDASTGEVDEHIEDYIRNLKVMQGGIMLSYQLKPWDNNGIASNKDSISGLINEENIHEYLFAFDLEFQPGENQVYLSYEVNTNSDIFTRWSVDFGMENASKWGKGYVEDFTVILNTTDNEYFEVTDVFGGNTKWIHVGVGKVIDNNNSQRKNIRSVEGKLIIEAKNFELSNSLDFRSRGFHSFFDYSNSNWREIEGVITDHIAEALKYLRLNEDLVNSKSYKTDELRFMRNFIYACKGYLFQDKELLNVFSLFEWYLPDPNLKIENIYLNEREKEFVESIRKAEKRIGN